MRARVSRSTGILLQPPLFRRLNPYLPVAAYAIEFPLVALSGFNLRVPVAHTEPGI